MPAAAPIFMHIDFRAVHRERDPALGSVVRASHRQLRSRGLERAEGFAAAPVPCDLDVGMQRATNAPRDRKRLRQAAVGSFVSLCRWRGCRRHRGENESEDGELAHSLRYPVFRGTRRVSRKLRLRHRKTVKRSAFSIRIGAGAAEV